jgi:hypothetical protein
MSELNPMQQEIAAEARSQAETLAEKQKAEKIAQEDLTDTRELQRSLPWKRYFVRRLNMKRDRLIQEIVGGVPLCAYESNVEQIRLIKEILEMPHADEISAYSLLHPGKTPTED